MGNNMVFGHYILRCTAFALWGDGNKCSWLCLVVAVVVVMLSWEPNWHFEWVKKFIRGTQHLPLLFTHTWKKHRLFPCSLMWLPLRCLYHSTFFFPDKDKYCKILDEIIEMNAYRTEIIKKSTEVLICFVCYRLTTMNKKSLWGRDDYIYTVDTWIKNEFYENTHVISVPCSSSVYILLFMSLSDGSSLLLTKIQW